MASTAVSNKDHAPKGIDWPGRLGWGGRLPDVFEDTLGGGRLGDEGDDRHRLGAAKTYVRSPRASGHT
ncbi:MAG: hypothetical protein ACREV3_00475, partial [Gammaproteobacteria bacterium]